MSLRASIGLTVLACASLATGCFSTGPKAQWVSREIACPSEQVLWEFLLLSLTKTGFPIGIGTDPAGRKLDSGWNMSLAPFKGEGWREKASVEYDRIGDGLYEVRVRVQREVNEDIMRPLDPSFAVWEPEEDDTAQAQHVLTFLVSFIGADLDVDQARTPDP